MTNMKGVFGLKGFVQLCMLLCHPSSLLLLHNGTHKVQIHSLLRATHRLRTHLTAEAGAYLQEVSEFVGHGSQVRKAAVKFGLGLLPSNTLAE